jgi:hypothetical protein
MRRPFLAILLFLSLTTHAYAFGSTACGINQLGKLSCVSSINNATGDIAAHNAIGGCNNAHYQHCTVTDSPSAFQNTCKSIAQPLGSTQWASATADTAADASSSAIGLCFNLYKQECRAVLTSCDTESLPLVTPPTAPDTPQHSPATSVLMFILSQLSNLLNMGAIGTGVSFGIGVIIALLIYAKRTAIANLIIHDGLPLKLPVYGEDIQCLFKRTQRVNWYGRVIFGIVANLSMTHVQLTDVRKYWLGRVIAFDSLRRQRQNELARMHLQLALSTTPETKEKRPRYQLWAAFKRLLFAIFYLIRALFSFLFGFLFIRVTVAKLARGTHIESKDLVLVLQAKQAIEESAKYLKEYLITANTFDGRDAVFDAE